MVLVVTCPNCRSDALCVLIRVEHNTVKHIYRCPQCSAYIYQVEDEDVLYTVEHYKTNVDKPDRVAIVCSDKIMIYSYDHDEKAYTPSAVIPDIVNPKLEKYIKHIMWG